jgi:hypothetical protein
MGNNASDFRLNDTKEAGFTGKICQLLLFSAI